MIPILAGRSRYVAVNQEAVWHYHTMAAGSLDGLPPQAVGETVETTDPTVTAGRLEFANLEHGGLFTLEGHSGKSIIVEAADGGTGNIVNASGTTIRAIPTTFPFILSPGEYLKVSSGTKAGFLMRLAGEHCL